MTRDRPGGIDRSKLRLVVLGVLITGTFVLLFSRLWFLQVLASDDYLQLAKENRVRRVESEPARGLILDRNGTVLVENKKSIAVALDRELIERPVRKHRVLRKLARLLDIPKKELNEALTDGTVSPYKPVAVATDVSKDAATYIDENPEDFPGATIELLPLRRYPQKDLAAHVLGYVNEISAEDLESSHFKDARPAYAQGDVVGKDGVEYSYDRWLRGAPAVRRVIVNSAGDVVRSDPVEDGDEGANLHLSLDAGIQDLAQRALAAGIEAARGAYQAPGGAVVVLDPNDGAVRALASYPTYDPRIAADGFTTKEFANLGSKTPNNPDDDALFNRSIAGQRQPGSTFKVVTAGAAQATGVADPYTQLDCPGATYYPPDRPFGAQLFRNWTSAHFGSIGFERSLEISCNTFYYELGWRMETAFGPSFSAGGDGSERFQKYVRTAGFGHDTGIDLPNEKSGVVPDVAWCKANEDIGYCPDGWLPGYTINMAIGQGDLVVTPLQMAVTYAAIANGGTVYEPRLAESLTRTDERENEQTVRSIEPKVAARLPLDAAELDVIQEGLVDVVAGADGTARGAFAGFPLNAYPIAGKTGTAQLDEAGELNDAWFVSYGPADSAEYVIAVYVEKAGHGGETAAPIARQIWEGIFGIDKDTNVRLGQDFSG
ncbi:MAG: penicillin-binding protein 2 [Chloroflexi bacterium]|nr:penicillin-binding protein 2 [Chloroflexota bacterium]